jgi:WD repeat-containing protein 61
LFIFFSLVRTCRNLQEKDSACPADGAAKDTARYLCCVEQRVEQIAICAGHMAPVYAIAPGRTADTVFSASGDRFVAEWNVRTGKQEPFAVKLEHPVYAVCHVPEMHLLLVGNAVGGLHVIDLDARKEVRYLLQHTDGIFDIAWDAAHGQLIVAGGDGVLSVWSMPDAELLIALPVIPEKLRQIALRSGEPGFALACGDGSIRLFDPVFFNESRLEGTHVQGATSVAFHPSKPAMLSGGRDAFIRVHSTADMRELLAIPAHNFAVYSMAFSPGGDLLATASRDKTIKIWDAVTLEPLVRLDARTGGHSHSVNRLLWLEDGTLVSCSDDRRIISWKFR